MPYKDVVRITEYSFNSVSLIIEMSFCMMNG